MRCLLAKSNRQLIWRIRALTLIISVVIVFGATPVFARGGAHSGAKIHAGTGCYNDGAAGGAGIATKPVYPTNSR